MIRWLWALPLFLGALVAAILLLTLIAFLLITDRETALIRRGWRAWFAWYPVRIDPFDESRVWLKWIERERDNRAWRYRRMGRSGLYR